MNTFLLAIATGVIKKASREHPADEVLRTELKAAHGISRMDGGEISRAVFSYYRWLRRLDETISISEQIQQALAFDEVKNRVGVSDSDLAKAVPPWIKEQVMVSPAWLRELQGEPRLWLRAKSGTGAALADQLGDCCLAGEGIMSDTLLYEGENDLFRTAEFHEGRFELQDVSSQAVSWVCGVKPGQTWWDACAGEGGKTLHLSELMQNKGLLWASDRAEWRLQKLKRRAARAKVFNYRAVLWDGGAKLPTKTKFDGVLVDAPCSGVGTWQRNPQARWTTTLEDVTQLSALQKQLLANVVPSLKPGGRLIYSVCTLTEAETADVAEFITQKFPELKPVSFKNPFTPDAAETDQIWLWPQDMSGNGMFICGWEKSVI